MKFGTYNELIAFAFEKFQAPTAREIEKLLTFAASHSYEEVLSQNFNLDIRPSTITTKAPSATKYEAHKKNVGFATNFFRQRSYWRFAT